MLNETIFNIIKIFLTIFVAILIPVYWKKYGPQNFLWLSDVGLFLTVIGFWIHSPLLISIAIIAIMPLELAWNIDFFVQLFTGYNLIGIADYMFQSKYSQFLKSLSLFHIFMPLIWFWYLRHFGYVKEAFAYAVILVWIILIATYLLTDPRENTNWVFNPYIYKWKMRPVVWLIMLMVGLPLVMIWPTHEILKFIFS